MKKLIKAFTDNGHSVNFEKEDGKYLFGVDGEVWAEQSNIAHLEEIVLYYLVKDAQI